MEEARGYTWLNYLACEFDLLTRSINQAHLCERLNKMPSISFQPILDAALADYRNQVGTDLATRPLGDKLRSCDSPDDVLKLLEDKASEFKEFRDGNRKLLNWLRPVVQVVHTLSTVLGASISLVSRKILVRSIYSLFHQFRQVPFEPSKAIFAGVDVLIAVRIQLHSRTASPHYIWILQAASGVSSSYDALVDLFECLGNFFKRIRIFSELLTPSMAEISVKIMAELLSVLALATKEIKQGRFSKWMRLLDMRRLNVAQRSSRRKF